MDDGVFRDLEPPPGGLVRLRSRLSRRRVQAWWVPVVVVVAAVWFARPRPAPRSLDLDAGMLGWSERTAPGIVSLDPSRLAVQPVARQPGVWMVRVDGPRRAR